MGEEKNGVLRIAEYSHSVDHHTVIGRAYAVFVELFKEIVIEEGIEIISPEAFLNQSELEKVTLPSSVKRIDSAAFKGCRGHSQVLDLSASRFPKV